MSRPTPNPNPNPTPVVRGAGRTASSFDHERLEVYRYAIDFVAWSTALLERIPPRNAVHSQLDRAATSMPLNIAEGNGKFTATDRCRFFDNARGSALECAACLDVAVARKVLDEEQVREGKRLLRSIVSMLVGLIKSQPSNRVYDEAEPYLVREGENHESE